MLSADHVYRFDIMDAIATHRRTGAQCTIVTTTLPVAEATDHATVEHDDDGRVTGFAYKPDSAERPGRSPPRSSSTTRRCWSPSSRACTASWGRERGEGDTGLGDYGEHLLRILVHRGKVFVHPMKGYWKDLGQPHKYVAAHHDVAHRTTSACWTTRTGRSWATSSSARPPGCSTEPA